MSENQSPQPALDANNRPAQDSSMDDAHMPLVDSVEQMTIESIQPDSTVSVTEPSQDTPSTQAVVSGSTASEATVPDSTTSESTTSEEEALWETASLPGTVTVAPTAANATDEIKPTRENELLTLIHDLNECNDVLLSRVSQLESSLSESQRKLQQASEHSKAEKSKMAEQLSVEQLTAQQASQNAQQQVANVVAQLETAEQSLQRQQLMNETLQSELNNAQERVSQLEHDCAISAQKHAEEAQARVKAESTIRDLRSRLQRQQRYTLQFKAALEKSLTVTARSADTSSQSGLGNRTMSTTARPTPFSTTASGNLSGEQPAVSNGVTMPKAQRIMPWAGGTISPFEGIDPHLENLIRGANTPKRSPETPLSLEARFDTPVDPSAVNQPGPAQPEINQPDVTVTSADSDAEDKLWQDIERVIESSSESSPDEKLDTPTPVVEDVVQIATEETVSSEISVEAISEETISEEAGSEEITSEKITTETVLTEEVPAETSEDALAETSEQASDQTPEPKLNWQRKAVPSDAELVAQSIEYSLDETLDKPLDKPLEKILAEVSAESLPVEPINAISADVEDVVEKEPLIQALEQKPPSDRAVVIDPYRVPEGQTPAAEVAFSEPSPWGKPLRANERSEELVDASTQSSLKGNPLLKGDAVPADYLPLVDAETSGVSPTVNPLRTQKKIGSMSAVQLPTFEKAKAGSFKR